MEWEQKAIIACEKRGLEVLGFEGGWVFVRDTQNNTYPVSEENVAKWISANK